MFKKMAWLLMAVLTLSGALANAAAPERSRSVNSSVAARTKAPDQIIGTVPVAPTSTDRMLAPDQYPSNVVKILRTSNKAQTNSYVPVVFDFKNTNPFNAIRFLHRPVQLEAGEIFTFVNDTNTGGKVMFVVPDYMVPSLRDLVATVDRKGITSSAGDKFVYAQLKHRRASETDPAFLDTVVSFTSGNGETALTDPDTNALFLRDSPSGSQSAVEALGNWLDVPTAMLDLVVKVYEIDSINDEQIGLDYMAWKNGPGANLFAAGAFAEHGSIKRAENVATPALPRNNFTATGYNYAFRYDVPSAFFDFLAVKGKARVLNEAKLAALNTKPAELTAGDQVLYYAVETTDPSGIRDTGKPFQANGSRVVVGTTTKKDLTPVQTGLSLKVVPVIGEQTINLDLNLSWTDYNFVDDTGFPQLNRRSLKSILRSKIGEEIIIGGLERQTVVKSTKKAPILGSIPILGYAFGGETSPAEKSQLIVVITPSAVMKYNLAKTEAEKDYKVKPEEQAVIDQAGGTKKIVEPKAAWGTDQLGLDKDYGYIAENQK